MSTERQSCNAINCLSSSINISAGDDPIPVKFGPKDTDPQQEVCAFHTLHAEHCAVAVTRPSCTIKIRLQYHLLEFYGTVTLYLWCHLDSIIAAVLYIYLKMRS